MDDTAKLNEALLSVPAAYFDSSRYNQWFGFTRAYARAGGDFDVWDTWNQGSPEQYYRMNPEYVWKAAIDKGDLPEKEKQALFRMAMKWGSFTYAPEPSPLSDEEQLIEYLKAVFEPDEFVKIANRSFDNPDNPGKPKPDQRCLMVRARDLIQRLETVPINEAIHHYSQNAGVWIGANPIDGKGCSKANVTDFRHVLIESDSMPLDEQYAFLIKSKLPITALTHSGGKSLHALVRVDADSLDEYKQLTSDLFAWLAEQGFIVDTQNKNPDRLTRMPGACRGEEKQFLIDLNRGCSDYRTWMKKNLKPSFYEQVSEKGAAVFRHEWLGDWIMKTEHVKRIAGSGMENDAKSQTPVYYYDFTNGIYRSNESHLRYLMRKATPNLKDNQIKETLSYIKDITGESVFDSDDSKYIAFKNGILDLETWELKKPSKQMIITSVIPHNYNTEPDENDCIFAKTTMLEWADGDQDLARLLFEIIGNAMESRIEDWQRAVILFGQGATGKSACLSLIERILGFENTSALSLSSLSSKFHTLHLKDKKANVRNDISQRGIDESDTFKQAVLGDTMTGELKGKDVTKFKPYATLLFSCNFLPNIRDDQASVGRRLLLIPFKHQFEPGAVDISSRLKQESIIEAFISLAVSALKETIERKGYTRAAAAIDLFRQYKEETDSVFAYCAYLRDTYDINTFPALLEYCDDSVDNSLVSDWKAFRYRYKIFCEEEGLTPLNLTRRILDSLEQFYSVKLESVRTRNKEGKQFRTYRVAGEINRV